MAVVPIDLEVLEAAAVDLITQGIELVYVNFVAVAPNRSSFDLTNLNTSSLSNKEVKQQSVFFFGHVI